MVEYTATHFATEQKLMEEHDYPGMAEHVEHHNKLKVTLDNLVAEFIEDGATHILGESVHTFLGNWLIKHIKDVDMQFGKFLSDKGVTPAQ